MFPEIEGPMFKACFDSGGVAQNYRVFGRVLLMDL